MSLEVKIPPLGESISSGVLATWHVADGDTVKNGQALFELETDKITSEGLAEADGVISLKVEEGAEVKIGEVVAEIDTDAKGETAPTSSAPAEEEPDAPAAESTQSPAVRRLAEETDVDPSTVEGTGKAGRVTKGDMLAAAKSPETPSSSSAPTPAPKPQPAAAKPAASGERQTRKKMTPLRAKIAERLVQAQQQAAMLTTFNEVDMSAVMELRKKYQDVFVKKNGFKLGFMSFFTKAVVHALKEVPGVNAMIDGKEIVTNNYYDVGVAVSTPKGLMVPVIRDCDTLSMAGIESAIGEVAKRARDGKITLADLDGGVFTITNGGIFGSMLSTPILNAPQSAILGLHAINERPMAVNGEVVIRPMMYLALSYDHRLVDGKEAVTFLVKVKEAIEDPTRLLLDI
ncbi:2-oxoglutarate dehydrogenase complex dihydrolipoyllysine-residue succinyltransferase [Synoicihabitans lomoniglobus]|uniref:Dihydrolipoyllysine-residue succinyltransferase component of 2-oxoglutarate dehydrogenase complex n=1 Tax=Synoicihabitans lomoniglobus TaxID=2909285 RepID=A0AAF0CPY0_9BACT|nr:2-oxoglutarate dehydrogenase complex dihydrolipoyllysine-residue succinyltransferase [Opitutaceae bacterium LMO-M01]WED65898.1 2-oxoglutarate dehydrogenase complex dihydrolipoyllysine-residue succinyltransferase [Opitutaceae bacterium LMO-M01]